MLKCYAKNADVITAGKGSDLHSGLWINYDLERVRDGTLGEHASIEYMP